MHPNPVHQTSTASPSLAHHALHGLERQGLLTITPTLPGWPADLHLTTAGRERLQQWRAQRATHDRTTRLPRL
jgi:DNA-binding PadR family transcriptional regulator